MLWEIDVLRVVSSHGSAISLTRTTDYVAIHKFAAGSERMLWLRAVNKEVLCGDETDL